ncbi:MAG: nucleotidyl transferase AbiEii/AbiGii toxin family protein [Candidatus Binataceae bacterium]
MADKFLELSAKERLEALEVARTAGGRPLHLLEKDVWVVWTLAVMFSAPFGEHLVFKGGTSLSKAFKAIRRFSEDVDLTYDIRQIMSELPPGSGDLIPANRTQADKLSKAVKSRLPSWVAEHPLPEINRNLTQDGLQARPRADRDKIFIEYDPLAEGYGYVKPVVTLEFGARSSGEPCEVHKVVCDAAEHLPDLLFPEASPRVMRVERTFWEKATAAHVFCCQGVLGGEGFSRHWYDIVRLDDAGYAHQALVDREVAMAVAVYKNAFFREKDGNGRVIDYRAAVRGSLRLAPKGAALEALRADYSKMVDEGAMLEQDESFDELIERCRSIENEANEFDKKPD